ncbi:hypothetical protein ACIBKY_54005 [Nonomuraea sp. NPDC050394]|uniref:hypothetical protein n=1 Tax=Nonomuraea sp. NPDC050394 TaxID=3364363 RepID=UPI00378CFA3F
MRLVVQVKLLPTPERAAALEATLRTASRAADLVAKIAFEQRCFRNHDLREHTYDQIKAEFGPAAQHVVKKGRLTRPEPSRSRKVGLLRAGKLT